MFVHIYNAIVKVINRERVRYVKPKLKFTVAYLVS